MVLLEFSKNYLNILMEPLFQHFFVRSSYVKPVVFCLNLNKALLTGKLSRVPALLKAG